MAVVQISKIQIRRGKSLAGTGFPQLASGELGWAIDTQELYIGNGAVSEGAPAVGNTKVITEYDFTSTGILLNTLKHIYGSNNPDINITTGVDSNNPVARSVQRCLDDRVNLLDFGAGIEGIYDYSVIFQRAIDQLFLNTTSKASAATVDSTSARVTLELPAGQINISSTIYVPSYATIIGAGIDKTIISYTGTGPVFQFVNDTSVIGSYSNITSTHGINQPRHITLKGVTILTSTGNQPCLQLDAVKSSVFEELKLTGSWGNSYHATSCGIALNAISNIVTCEENIFKHIVIQKFSYGVCSKQDIVNNVFDFINISNVYKGVSFGEGSNGSSVGQQFGPRDNTISNAYFYNVLQQAIYVERGTGNIVENCKLENVGNNGGGHTFIQYPQIHFGQYGNVCNDIRSDRSTVLNNSSYYIKTVTLTLNTTITASKGAYFLQASSGAYGYLTSDVNGSTSVTLQNISIQGFTSGNLTIDGDSTPSTANTVVNPVHIGTIHTSSYIPYVPEVSGHGVFKTFGLLSNSLGSPALYASAIRLPTSADQYGDPQGSIIYKIHYQYKSLFNSAIRDGVLTVTADVDNAIVKLTDEYNFTGYDPSGTNSIKLDFRARFLDQTGVVYTGQISQIPAAIDVEYVNLLSGDNGSLTYTYTSSF